MRIHLLNVNLDALAMSDLNRLITEAVGSREQWLLAYHNLHSIYLFQRDQKFQEYYQRANIIHIDGMFLVYLARLFGLPVQRKHRVTYVDWIHPLMEMSVSRGWKVFYLGGKPGVAERAAERLRKSYSGLQLQTQHGYFDRMNEENASVLQAIKSYQPDVLMVGMGMPDQEHWLVDNASHLGPCVILAPGACFDYIAGAIPTPPRWMGQVGLEWLFRLVCEPKRLWRRYLVEPWHVLFLILKECFR